MIFLRPAVFALLAAAAAAAGAQSNMTFLQDAPLERMTREDLALMMKSSNEALGKNADGETSAWTNPKTGASGTITPLSSFTRKGLRCREAEYTNHAGGFNGRSRFTLCRVGDDWKIAG